MRDKDIILLAECGRNAAVEIYGIAGRRSFNCDERAGPLRFASTTGGGSTTIVTTP